MMCFCVGIALLSAAWLCLFPIFVPQALWGLGLAFAVAGVALIAWSSIPVAGRQRRQWPEIIRAIPPALGFCGIVLAWQFLALHSLRSLAANHHDLRALSPLLWGTARLFGLPMTLDDGVLFFETEEDVLPFVTNWEKVGFVMPVTLLAAMTIATMLSARGWKDGLLRGIGGIALLIVYTLMRYLILCGLLIEFGDPKGTDEHERLQLFTGVWPTLLSHLPFALLAARLRLVSLNLAALELGAKAFLQKPRLLASAGVSLAIVFGLVAIRLELPGSAKNGRVLVDDFHSGFWEPSVPALDTNGFGSQHLYNGSSLVEWLRYHYSVEVNTASPITEDLLRNLAVLVLKTPTKRFTSEEIAIVVSFLREGGGLLLIGDHTNLLGMGSFLNELAGRFGIQFQLDGSNAYSSGYFSSFEAPWLLAHPIVDGLPKVRFLTSCTLRYDPGVDPVMIAQDVISDPVDYSKPSFFGKLNPSPRNGFGLYPLAVALRFGQGRVVAFAESTTMSNFALFQDGTASFFLRVLTYLNHTNRNLALVRWGLGTAAFGLIGLALWQLGRAGRAALLFAVSIAGVAGYLAAGVTLKILNSAAWTTPASVRPLPCVAYLAAPGFNYDIPPAIGPSFVPEAYSFDGLFVVPQRFGAFPALTTASGVSSSRYRAVLAINPTDAIPASDLHRLADYVSAGGRLLVLQEPGRSETFVTNLLARTRNFRLLFERTFTLPSLITNAAAISNALAMSNSMTNSNTVGPTNAAPLPATVVEALKPRPLSWTAWSVQSGTVHVLSDSTLFSRAWMGNVMAEPSEPQRRVYELLFAVFRELLGTIERPPSKPEAATHSTP